MASTASPSADAADAGDSAAERPEDIVRSDAGALIVSPGETGYDLAGRMLRAGGLVAFPTETVYGLGANALNEEAVTKIFTTKGRPLTDPLIVHVADPQAALELLDLPAPAATIYQQLASSFWPGPLTLVGKAVSRIPLKVTAGTGFVGIRCPQHPIARQLLEVSRVPIAAPSANRFGHVSPTRAAHVHADLGGHPIMIIDGEMTGAEAKAEAAAEATCGVGIESTVAKVDAETKRLIVFRRGGVSESALRAVLDPMGFRLEFLSKKVLHDPEEFPDGEDKLPAGAAEAAAASTDGEATTGEQAPGQCLTHYAPDVPTSVVRVVQRENAGAADAGAVETPMGVTLGDCVVIDFGGHLEWARDRVLGYRDLSPGGDTHEAASNLFATLRWTEGVQGAAQVLVVDVVSVARAKQAAGAEAKAAEHLHAVADRLFRAASGTSVSLDRASGALTRGGGESP